ncbi:unnamed protein product, partial [marine sediment metagenome]
TGGPIVEPAPTAPPRRQISPSRIQLNQVLLKVAHTQASRLNQSYARRQQLEKETGRIKQKIKSIGLRPAVTPEERRKKEEDLKKQRSLLAEATKKYMKALEGEREARDILRRVQETHAAVKKDPTRIEKELDEWTRAFQM